MLLQQRVMIGKNLTRMIQCIGLLFFNADSVIYFGYKAIYKADEEAGMLTILVDYGAVKDTIEHEVLQLDASELWIKDIHEITHVDMKFFKDDPEIE